MPEKTEEVATMKKQGFDEDSTGVLSN